MLITEAIWKAWLLTKAVQKNEIDFTTKDDKSPVTVADFGSQAIIHHFLKTNYPNDEIISEETADALREDFDLKKKVFQYVSEIMNSKIKEEDLLDLIDYRGIKSSRRWYLDPIDGTKGFLRDGQYAIALALVENNIIQYGILGCPNFDGGVLLEAEKGRGTTCYFPPNLNGILKANVSKVSKLENVTFCNSFEKAHSSSDAIEELKLKIGNVNEIIKIDSQAKYALVALGKADAYIRVSTSYVQHGWDHAAGIIIVQEAGGKVTDINGKEIDFSTGQDLSNNSGIVASNGLVHDMLVEAY